jgi:hypothetical protein
MLMNCMWLEPELLKKFIINLKDTPQYKKCWTKESTSNKMSDESLIEYVATQFK